MATDSEGANTQLERSSSRGLKKLPTPGTLDHAFLSVGGRETAISMSRLASYKDPQIKEFVRLYDTLSLGDRKQPEILEQLVVTAGMHPAEFFGRICAIAYRYNFDVATFTAAVASPMVLQKAAEFAMEQSGFKDRELILKASKILEQQSLVTVQQNQQNINVGSNLPQITGKISEIIRGELTEGVIDGEIIEENVPSSSDSEPSSRS